MTLLTLDRVKTYYAVTKGIFSKPSYVRAVDDVSLSIERGETIALVGESGCGKTTLGKTALRLLTPVSGRVIFEGRDITYAQEKELKWFRREAQAIFQDPYSCLDPMHSIAYSLREPLAIHKIGDEKEKFERICKALEEVKLTPPEDFLRKYPHMLSGGQRQRVAIARAIILEPKFIVADEPVSMLDASVRAEILDLLSNLQRKMQVALLYITHDISTAKYISHKVAVMYAGKIIEMGKFRDVIHDPMHPYTQALIDVTPEIDPENRLRIRKTIAGEPPNLINPPTGCRFHPRCPVARDICKREEPYLSEVKIEHYVACHVYD